jgi:hypothetical protein
MALMSDNERKAYGVLGKPPEGWLQCSKPLIQEWIKLLRRAERVARMRFSSDKVREAKSIQTAREDLVMRMEMELERKN